MIKVILKEMICPECGGPAVEDDWMKRGVRENPFYLAQYFGFPDRSPVLGSLGVLKRFTCPSGHEFFWQADD